MKLLLNATRLWVVVRGTATPRDTQQAGSVGRRRDETPKPVLPVDGGMTDDTDESAESVAEESVSGTFVVTHTDEETAVLQDAETGQVHTLSEHPDLTTETVVEATLAPEPPMGVTYALQSITEQRTVRIEQTGESPTSQAREIAAEQDVGDVTRQERAGTGELHVISVPDEQTESAVADVLEDRETRLVQAARAEASLVEVRSEPGVVVRYLP